MFVIATVKLRMRPFVMSQAATAAWTRERPPDDGGLSLLAFAGDWLFH
jgi:hypothetical protein